MKKFNMKKTTAAAVAATVGAVLLLGGAGTLAYWSDTADSAPQVISSGQLDLGSLTDSGWTVTNGSNVTTNFTGVIVPGDKLTKTISVPVTLAGANMNARLDVATPWVETSNAELKKSVVVAVDAIDTTNGATKNFTSTSTAAVKVSVTFPTGAGVEPVKDAADNTQFAQNKTVTFGTKYTLTQVAK